MTLIVGPNGSGKTSILT
ncbi:MAG: ATP-binding protein [Pseudanabaena sp.]